MPPLLIPGPVIQELQIQVARHQMTLPPSAKGNKKERRPLLKGTLTPQGPRPMQYCSANGWVPGSELMPTHSAVSANPRLGLGRKELLN